MNKSGISIMFGVGGITVFDANDRDATLRSLVDEELSAMADGFIEEPAPCLRASANEMRALADMLDKAANEQG